MAQLPLAITLNPHASFAGFVSGPNEPVVRHLKAIADGQRQENLWIHGATGTGKSHLLGATCRQAGEAGLTSIYVALSADSDPGVLGELEDVGIVAIDNADQVAGIPDWEAALFSLLDARLQGGGLVFAARAVPADCGFALQDLVSRATAAASYRLRHLDDEQLREAVLVQAAARGLGLDDAVATYLVQRFSRNLTELIACLDRLDRFSLAAQRRITIPLLRDAISL